MKMAQTLCKLCLFKSEPLDEICMEESDRLREIVTDIFREQVPLSKFELDGICTVCRDKLKSFHDYYKFVLENQKQFNQSLRCFEPSQINPVFIGVVKEEPLSSDVKPDISNFHKSEDDYEPDLPRSDDGESDESRPKRSRKKKRIQKPRKHVLALQKQQSDLIGLLFDFKCDFCEHTDDTYRGIFNHCKKVHKKVKSWTCCEKEMRRDTELIEHVLEHKGEWKCCGRCFSSPVDLWKHNNKKHNEPSIIPYEDPHNWLKPQVMCDICKKKFRTVTIIIRHMKDVHIKNYTCYICNAEFYHKKEYAKHRRDEHSSILKIPCPLCKVILKNELKYLTDHMKNLHNKEPFICATCGKVCKNDHAMRIHTIREHKPRKYKCSFCEKMFKTRLFLKDHEATHTGISRYFCDICGAPFKSSGNFSAHKRRLHPVEYEKQKLERIAKKYQM